MSETYIPFMRFFIAPDGTITRKDGTPKRKRPGETEVVSATIQWVDEEGQIIPPPEYR